jgi:hypothetical protein
MLLLIRCAFGGACRADRAHLRMRRQAIDEELPCWNKNVVMALLPPSINNLAPHCNHFELPSYHKKHKHVKSDFWFNNVSITYKNLRMIP